MFSLAREEKWIKISLLVLSAIFFSISLYAVLRYGDSNFLGSLDKMNNDDVKYIRSAWTFLDTGMLTYQNADEPTVFIMPGLPLTLAFFMSVFGKIEGITAFRIFQVILQTFSLFLVFFIGRKTFNSRVAIMACGLNLFYVAEFYAATLILTEVIFKFLLLLLVYISFYAVEEKRTRYYVLGGLVWGAACLFRPTIAAYPAVIFVIWLIKRYTLREMFKYTVITLTIFSAVLSPWWIRNDKIYDRFIPLTLSSGNPFLQGTYVNYDQSKDYTNYTIGKTEIESNQNQMNAGIDRLKTYGVKEPLKYLYWYTLGKSFYLWRIPFYWKEILGVPIIAAAIFHVIILGMAVAGIIRSFKGKDKRFTLTFTVIVYFNLIYLPYYAFERYAYPVMPFVMIFAAFTILEFFKKRWGRFRGEAEGSYC
ncbi:glycosyltransferase family 39 protein [Desulfitobacterium sp.]|uniref:glycosyltransferase family 39 protein n=1 Tax=Desulfitobacterium sp. TaxID=49981 RepID=UPI002B1EB17C|nr:glycosyltransferase family 39 protein [Desulfitobacterium sp.]MEA4900289.1 glycosyltransferase family 39 protein [Desulfitobacterium sp.]